jgi:hypothetical protein
MDDAAIMVAAAPAGALAVTDAKATALTLYQDKPQVGCAARDFGKWKSVFIGSPGVSADFLNNLATWSGCWVASPVGDAVYGSQHFLTIHALFPGHKTLRLPQRSKVTDLTSGKVLSERSEKIEVDMERGQTRWFRLEAK